MRLDRVAIALRMREPWEAIDLGAVMIRTWGPGLYKAWLAVFLPLALITGIVFADAPWIALIVLWWLKPFYDRVILHVLGQAVFGSMPGVRATFQGLGTMILSTGLVGALTWRRLDPLRSFNLPVRQLELQRGAAARTRERLLGRRASGQATGLLYACMAFEIILVASLDLCRDLVLPAGIGPGDTGTTFLEAVFLSNDAGWLAHMRTFLYAVAVCAVEPLYVASGFSLYLNRRTALEAWDLELAFRRMHPDDAGSAPVRSAASVVLGIALACLMMQHPQLAWASAPTKDSRTLIKEVLAAPEFEEFDEKPVWRYRGETEKKHESSSHPMFTDLLTSIAEALAQLGRFAAYVVIAVVLFLIVRYLVKSAIGLSGPTGDGRTAEHRPPPTLFGLDVRPESLPDDLAQIAARAAAQDPRLALSLLYRGALAILMHRDGLRIEHGDTEGDCLQHVRTLQAPLADYFARLVDAWSLTAYAGRVPEHGRIQTLCSEWTQFFGPAAGSDA